MNLGKKFSFPTVEMFVEAGQMDKKKRTDVSIYSSNGSYNRHINHILWFSLYTLTLSAQQSFKH
jgi:hypothetical protein